MPDNKPNNIRRNSYTHPKNRRDNFLKERSRQGNLVRLVERMKGGPTPRGHARVPAILRILEAGGSWYQAAEVINSSLKQTKSLVQQKMRNGLVFEHRRYWMTPTMWENNQKRYQAIQETGITKGIELY